MTKGRGWHEPKKYDRLIGRRVAPRHRAVALKNQRTPSEIIHAASLRRYGHGRFSRFANINVNWDYYTGAADVDHSIKKPKDPKREYDCYYQWVSIDDLIETHKNIIYAHYTGTSYENATSLDPAGEQIEITYPGVEQSVSKDDLYNSGINRTLVNQAKEMIERGHRFPSFAVFYDKKGNMTTGYYEARNRLAAMKELGVDRVPVWMCVKRYD